MYRLGLAKSRAAARQFVGHGHIVVNGKKTDISSFSVKEGDEIEVRERTSSRQLATQSMEGSQARDGARMVEFEYRFFKGYSQPHTFCR